MARVKEMKSMKVQKADLDWGELPFGYVKTDYNVRYYFKDGKWSEAELTADEFLPMHMAAPCLHYGQEAFEGLKIFETVDGRIVAFRVEENAKRLQKSSERIFTPMVPIEMFREAVHKVVKANARFVPPYGTGASMYARPLIIGTGARVGLGPAEEYVFLVFVTPVGPYYKGGFKAVKALVVEEYDRAAPQGVGDCKVGGNYAGSLRASQKAHECDCNDVLWLDAIEHKYVEEVGSSNAFFMIGDEIITAPLAGTILPGITRDSVLTLLREWGIRASERKISIDDIIEAAKKGELKEAFASGTAAVISPMGLLHYQDKEYTIGNREVGPISQKLYDTITGIQTGKIADTHGWIQRVV